MKQQTQTVTIAMAYTGVLVVLHTNALGRLKNIIKSSSGLLGEPSPNGTGGIRATVSSGGSGLSPGANSGGGNSSGGGGSW